MLTASMLLIGAAAAIGILALIPRLPSGSARIGAVVAAGVVFIAFFTLSSFRYVGENQIGVVIKNVGVGRLPEGRIIATAGQMGPQARILPPGWHPWLWPIVYDIEFHPVIEIEEGEVGLITATDGKPLPDQMAFAPEWKPEQMSDMLNAEYFLTTGNGYKGPQTTVLKPGRWRLNPKLFIIEKVPATNIEKATVGVVKSNVGQTPEAQNEQALVERGMQGIWLEPLYPAKYYINTKAYEVTIIHTRKSIVRYTAATAGAGDEESEIRVRTSDGFTFPVDVRVEYEIKPEDAPLVVARVGNDQEGLLAVMNSAVRAIFRNNAEGVRALDYVQQRSQQESQSLGMLQEEMHKIGVTVTAVRIGDVGDDASLGALLKTQTDREIAKQEQLTFQEQQRAAEQKKELSRTEQEAEEERRLATASYQVQIAQQEKERVIIEAGAEAEAITIKAQAQAQAFRAIAEQIGKGNAALIELLKIVGEKGIQITPRVMVRGSGSASEGNAETIALIGTLLDQMTADENDDDR
ncbi:MAG: SPFH domain-containing protein [Phycisphaerales bacterium]